MLLDKKILLRVTESEREKIQVEARQRGLSVNDYLRTVALRLPLQQAAELEQRVSELEEQVAGLQGRRPARAVVDHAD